MNCNNMSELEIAKSMEEMWNDYEAKNNFATRINAKHLESEILIMEKRSKPKIRPAVKSKKTNQQEKGLHSRSRNPYFAEDFEAMMRQEISQKMCWARANASRAYVG